MTYAVSRISQMVGAPSFSPRNAARHRIDAAAITFAKEKRRLRASWSSIAAMLQVSEPDLRAAADPDWPKPKPAAVAEADATPLGRLTRIMAVFGVTRTEARILMAILALPGAPLMPQPEETASWRNAMQQLRAALAAKGLPSDAIRNIRFQGYVISDHVARRINAMIKGAAS